VAGSRDVIKIGDQMPGLDSKRSSPMIEANRLTSHSGNTPSVDRRNFNVRTGVVICEATTGWFDEAGERHPAVPGALGQEGASSPRLGRAGRLRHASLLDERRWAASRTAPTRARSGVSRALAASIASASTESGGVVRFTEQASLGPKER
jgi:hypothetical protein